MNAASVAAATGIATSSIMPKRKIAVEAMTAQMSGTATAAGTMHRAVISNSPHVKIVSGHGAPNVGVNG
jgi:hypothetical protein